MVQNERPPRFIVQPDWDEAVQSGDDEVWFAIKRKGETINSLLHKCRNDDNSSMILTSSDPNVEVEVTFSKTLTLKHQLFNLFSTFYAPSKIFKSVHEKSVQTLDVNDTGLGVSASSDCKLYVWETQSGVVRRSLEGHVGDVYCSKFFPSGLVLLTAGADMIVKIWSVDTGVCAQNIIGHRQAVTDAAFVDKGRNIVTCSKDGTCRLWDCGSAACISVIDKECGQFNAVSLAESELARKNESQTMDSNEMGTSDKILCAGCENGFLKSYALGTKEKLMEMKLNSAINTLSFLDDDVVVCGTQNGSLVGVDLRKSNQPLYVSDEDRGAVYHLTPYSNGYFVAFADGTIGYKSSNVDENSCGSRAEFTGADCDPVYRLAYDDNYLYSCCRDKIIRKYKLPTNL